MCVFVQYQAETPTDQEADGSRRDCLPSQSEVGLGNSETGGEANGNVEAQQLETSVH